MTRLSRRTVEGKAQELLESVGVTKPPVDVERIARRLGYNVVFKHLRGDVSGTVICEEDESITIGINTFHPSVRQRFSIAHELGHATLHLARLKEKPFVDPPMRVLFRDVVSSQGADPLEIQANQFAAALLMPQPFVAELGQALVEQRPQIGVDELVNRLAHRFDVSTQAMRHRLVTFGVVEPE